MSCEKFNGDDLDAPAYTFNRVVKRRFPSLLCIGSLLALGMVLGSAVTLAALSPYVAPPAPTGSILQRPAMLPDCQCMYTHRQQKQLDWLIESYPVKNIKK